jgi:hypothetical protein
MPQNLAAISAVPGSAWVLLEYGGSEWAEDAANLIGPLRGDDFAVFRTKSPASYSHSHAKNVCARAATALGADDWVCNLDADNFLTVEYIERVMRALTSDRNVIVRSPSSAAGRIACSSAAFHEVRGYDERFQGWGAEDCDFIARLLMISGTRYHPVEESAGAAIAHGEAERMQDMDGTLAESHRRNSALYQGNRAARLIKANPTGYGVSPDITRFY